jgi:hypothetical protein
MNGRQRDQGDRKGPAAGQAGRGGTGRETRVDDVLAGHVADHRDSLGGWPA